MEKSYEIEITYKNKEKIKYNVYWYKYEDYTPALSFIETDGSFSMVQLHSIVKLKLNKESIDILEEKAKTLKEVETNNNVKKLKEQEDEIKKLQEEISKLEKEIRKRGK